MISRLPPQGQERTSIGENALDKLGPGQVARMDGCGWVARAGGSFSVEAIGMRLLRQLVPGAKTPQ